MAYDEAQLFQALRNADAAGDFEAATQLAQLIQRNRASAPPADPRLQYAQAAMAANPARPESEVQRDLAMQELASEQGPVDAFLIGTGRGFYNIGRGIGLADPATDTENRAYAALERERPIATGAGQLVGESAPFVVPGAGAGAIGSTAARVAAMAGLGAAEGGIVARGRGAGIQDSLVSGAASGAVAGALELALPYVGRIAGQVVRRVTGQAPQGALIDAAGQPTAELADALAKSGLSMDDIGQAAMRELTAATPGTNPQQAARAALFATEGIPATRGNITKAFGQETAEARLAEAVADPAAAPFRAELLRQSEAFRGNLDDLVNRLGVPERTGESIKGALSGQRKLLSQQKGALYREASDLAKDSGGLPIIPDNIRAAIPDENALDDLAITAPGAVEALGKALNKYGIREAPEGYTGKVTPLTVENFESFRKLLNNIERSDQTGAASVAVGPIRSALDEEMDLLSDSVANPEILAKLRQARGIVREIKTEFSPQAMAGRLIELRRDGVTPTIEASQVSQRLFSKATPVEQLSKTMANLAKSGEAGQKAIGDLQASAVLRLMDEAFGASSRTIEGARTIGPGAFQKAIQKIGDDKLNVLFSGNKEALTRIRNLEKIAATIQPPAGAVPKGSASTMLDLVNRLALGKVPGLGPVVDLLSTVQASGRTRQEVARALNARPDVAQAAMAIDRDFPAIAAAIGIAGFSGQAAAEE